MIRAYELYDFRLACAPVSLATATASTPIWLDAENAYEAAVSVAHAQIASGKKLTVELYESDASDGTGAEKVGSAEKTFTAAEAGVYTVSHRREPGCKRYIGVKVTQDTDAAVILSATVLLDCPGKPSGDGTEI